MRNLTGASKPQQIPAFFCAEQINNHYANISTDNNYLTPPLKPVDVSDSQNCDLITERNVFYHLNTLKPTASGSDLLPFWFLRLCAAYFAAPLAYIYNLSLNNSKVPAEWKLAVIHPIPKVSNPTTPSDLRPISVISILSRILEKIVNKLFLIPALHCIPDNLVISNQYAYRPTASTCAAIIAMLQHITNLLQTEKFVYVLTFDYSKAFDTLRHSSVASKLTLLDIPDCIHNWILDYLCDRQHCTLLHNTTSQSRVINASIVQGSALGPTLFNINSTDLQPLNDFNRY